MTLYVFRINTLNKVAFKKTPKQDLVTLPIVEYKVEIAIGMSEVQ